MNDGNELRARIIFVNNKKININIYNENDEYQDQIFFESTHDIKIFNYNFAALALLFYGLNKSKNIFIDGPVSKELLNNLEWVQQYILNWWPHIFKKPILIYSKFTILDVFNNYDNHLLLFTGGIDSTYAFLNHEFGVNPRIFRNRKYISSFLKVLHVAPDNPPNRTIKQNNDILRVSRIADQFNKDIIIVKTNLRYKLNSKLFTKTCTSVLSAVSNLFQKSFEGCIIGSSIYPEFAHIGSHPTLDKYYSTNTFKFIHDVRLPRHEKFKSIYENNKYLYNNLMVCWEGYKYAKDLYLNCGKCSKCQRIIRYCDILNIDPPNSFETSELYPLDLKNISILDKAFLLEEIMAGFNTQYIEYKNQWVDDIIFDGEKK
jgi:hypothetical protein